jgi:hypothetical protein
VASPVTAGDAFYDAPMVTALVPPVKDRELTVTAPGCGPRDRDHGLLSGFRAGLPTATGVTDQNAVGIGAEAVGFEPTGDPVKDAPYGFAVRRIKPLCHASDKLKWPPLLRWRGPLSFLTLSESNPASRAKQSRGRDRASQRDCF